MYMRKLKQPTGPTTPRRFRNGKFLMTVFADSQRFPDRAGFELRDPYWLVAGWEGEEALPGGGTRKTILWSQPEILLYALPPCEVRNPPHPPRSDQLLALMRAQPLSHWPRLRPKDLLRSEASI